MTGAVLRTYSWLRRGLDATPVVCAATALVATLIAHHFAVTTLYVLPPNAISIASLTHTRNYINPMFRQQWSLFAPDPIGSDKHFSTLCRFAGETREQAEKHRAHPAAEYEALQRKFRVGPGSRMQRALTPTAWIFPPTDVYTKAIEKSAESSRDPALLRVVSRLASVQENTVMHRDGTLARISSYGCIRKYPGVSIVEVKPAITVKDPPPFTERGKADNRAAQRVDFEWTPYVSPERLVRLDNSTLSSSSDKGKGIP